MVKKCNQCGEEKPLKCFGKNKCHADGLLGHCRQCEKKRYRDYCNSLKGYINIKHRSQLVHTSKRNGPPVEYTKKEFAEWLMANDDFKEAYKRWVASGFDRRLSPSIRRIDLSKPFRLDNIKVDDWKSKLPTMEEWLNSK